MIQTYDVIVIGVGSMGAATCYQLARRGLRVLGLEQFGIPHQSGSHHGQTRMIRLAYFEHPDYVPLLQRAYAAWRELEVETGTRLLQITGGIYMGPPGSRLLAGAEESCRQHGLSYEYLDSQSLRDAFPQFQPHAGTEALFEEQAGFLVPEDTVAALAMAALAQGAEIHGLEAVRAWQITSQGAEVTTERTRYAASRIVFTSGAWTNHILRDRMPVDLQVTRQPLAWFAPRDPDSLKQGKLPVWFMETEDGHGHYGFPILPGTPGFKVGLHRPADEVDPDTVDRTFHERDWESLAQFLQQHIPAAAGPLLSGSVCLYTNSPDGHFIVDQLPEEERVFVCAGFSGHGFKFASVVGEMMADYVSSGRTQLPARFLRFSRFQ
ncbi:MAG: N-methyl-L-tryptophan oxidase [Planctomycetales bacterium]|nr:N-methyl-L-tryptophan oxidase [Planctomycetales bacterium]